MPTYICIDDIKDSRMREYAKKVDSTKPNGINDPNAVGDYNDNRLSEREIKKVEQMIREYYQQNPEYDDLGVQVPTGLSVSNAVKSMFDGTMSYLKYQAGETYASVKRKLANLF